MEHTLVVCRRQPGTQLLRDVDCLVSGQVADALQERCQVLAVNVLHREEVTAVEFADVVDAADIRMRDLARDADLGVEALAAHGIVSQRLWQELQRHGLPQRQVVGAINLAHPAASE
jgi:hypothetical protein